MSEFGITADQFVVLNVVANEPGLTQIELVERTASDPNTMAAILRRLELRGLVVRHNHARDGRARCVSLSASGRKLQRRAYNGSESLRAMLWDCATGLSRKETGDFLRRVHTVFSAPFAGVNGRPARRTRKAAQG
jgi:DNA-binding MarR family transcriptional regulator